MVLPPLDPELAAIEGMPPTVLSAEALPKLRARQRAAAALGAPQSDAVVRADEVVGEVPVRVHRPAGVDGALPAIVSLHGGGLVMGSHRTDDNLFEHLCPTLGVVGISVDYRLAPEHRYPAALDDTRAVLAWVHDRADDLGVDRARVGVRGVSAGGNLAAALALVARDQLAFQLLDAPMLDDRQVTASSQQDDLAVWSRESNTFGWRSYLGDLHGTDTVPIDAAPARATDADLVGLPPAFVSVGALDGFRDEASAYALRLNHAGVPCELHVYAGAPHGYHLAGDSGVARRARADLTDWLRRTMS
jgi:acetyl esterase/lipase